MRQVLETIEIETARSGLYEITGRVSDILASAGLSDGLLTLFCRHTSCSLVIQENADPDVRTDLLAFFARLVPEGMDFVTHTLEGPDDMPAHIKAALTQTSLSIPIAGKRLALGTWQGIYLFEHRAHPHRRKILAHLIGE